MRLPRLVAACVLVVGTAGFAVGPATVAHADVVVASVSAGLTDTCAVTTAGALECWGWNQNGQVGDGTTTNRSVPTSVVGLSAGVAAVSTSDYYSCALLVAGTVKCWGANFNGVLGDGTTNESDVPVDVAGLSGVTAIAAGGYTACALNGSGAVSCWGGGFGSTSTPVAGLGSGVTALAGGDESMCALTNAGAVECFGLNDYGQLGDGTTTADWVPSPVATLGSGVVAIGQGVGHTCVVTSLGTVKCWGRNDYGQLGDGTKTERLTPVDVVGLDDITAVSGTIWGTCALTSAGAVECWGASPHGELGSATTDPSLVPVPVMGLSSGVASISSGVHHTCALTVDGAIYCWGLNEAGELGNGASWTEPVAKDVLGLGSGVTAVGAGYHHTCAVTSSGALQCWGINDRGELGDGTNISRSAPADVATLQSGVATVTAGYEHTCALTVNGAVECWGDNSQGELGDGTTTRRYAPVPVVGLGSGVQQVSAGAAFTCALLDSGTVKCWGDNSTGEIGDGTTTDRHAPVDVSALGSNVTQISAGGNIACAVTTAGAVKCWGQPELGDGTTQGSAVPVAVSGLNSGVAAVSVGTTHVCVLTTAGAVECWGDDYTGASPAPLVPTPVAGLGSGVAAIDASASSTCVLTTSHAMKCWGWNGYGELGNGDTTTQTSPVGVIGLGAGVTSIVAEGDHACAVTTGGALHCFGGDSNGQLGLGPGGQSLVPGAVIGFGLGSAVPSSAPASVSAAPADGAANTSWTPPLDDGGATVYGYVVTVVDASGGTATAVQGAKTRTTSTATALASAMSSVGASSFGTNMHFSGLSNTRAYRLDVTPITRAGLGRARLSGVVRPGSRLTTAAGYWMADRAGHVYAFGSAPYLGNAKASSVTSIASTPSLRGYWLVDAVGNVFSFGDARYFGGAGTLGGEFVIGIESTPTGYGYWLFTTRGRVISRGDAGFFGDLARVNLDAPIVGATATSTGRGYYMVGADGGVFTFGDAKFHGSTGGMRLDQPVRGIVSTPDGSGYWLVAADGGVFAFHAPFRGSMGGKHLNRPVVSMTPYGNGYLLVGSDGGIFDFSNRPFAGSLGGNPPQAPVVAAVAA